MSTARATRTVSAALGRPFMEPRMLRFAVAGGTICLFGHSSHSSPYLQVSSFTLLAPRHGFPPPTGRSTETRCDLGYCDPVSPRLAASLRTPPEEGRASIALRNYPETPPLEGDLPTRSGTGRAGRPRHMAPRSSAPAGPPGWTGTDTAGATAGTGERGRCRRVAYSGVAN